MPLIEYRCKDCSTHFEILSGVTQDAEETLCPSCGSAQAEKLLSGFSAKVGSSSPGSCDFSSPPRGGCGAGCACMN